MMRPQELVGSEVYDQRGEAIGKVGTVYVSEDSQQPEWVTVRTGMFGLKETFVPLSGAEEAQDGLHVHWDKEMVKDAPRIDADGRLSEEESMRLYQYYGLPTQRDGGRTRGRQGAAGGTRTGDATMTRSEERLRVGTERVESGRVRLRKYVVTEEQQMTVPVTREEVRIEREPVDSRRPGAHARIGEEEQEVVLHEERPVVGKETVPVEQVRARTEKVAGQQHVQGEVRKERIETDGPDRRSR